MVGRGRTAVRGGQQQSSTEWGWRGYTVSPDSKAGEGGWLVDWAAGWGRQPLPTWHTCPTDVPHSHIHLIICCTITQCVTPSHHVPHHHTMCHTSITPCVTPSHDVSHISITPCVTPSHHVPHISGILPTGPCTTMHWNGPPSAHSPQPSAHLVQVQDSAACWRWQARQHH